VAIIRDIVDVRARPTVVRLEEAAGADWVSASYHLTPDVSAHVRALERAFAMPHGVGAFLVAPYGAGKSHFLAWLASRVEAGEVASPAHSVVRLSLLNHRAALGLEAIVLGALGKEGRSIRQLHETYPLPSAYDRLVPGRALAPEERRFLERVCEGLGVAPPADASVLAEQRAVQIVRAALREKRTALERVREVVECEPVLAQKIDELERWCAMLDPPADELDAMGKLAGELGAASRLIDPLRELEDLPQRVERAKRELARFAHLAQQPAMAGEPLGEPPPLGETSALEAWLARAGERYAAYVARYREAHDRFWLEQGAPSVWKPPRVAESGHLGLDTRSSACARSRGRRSARVALASAISRSRPAVRAASTARARVTPSSCARVRRCASASSASSGSSSGARRFAIVSTRGPERASSATTRRAPTSKASVRGPG
jgi:hypothetical protein